jgi:hypothetical protein
MAADFAAVHESKRYAVRKFSFARSRDVMSTHETLLGRSSAPRASGSPGVNARRSRWGFAHLKRILQVGRLGLRGPRGAQDEFVLAAIA